jgi:hypothetical protein
MILRDRRTGTEEIVERCDEKDPWKSCSLGYRYLLVVSDYDVRDLGKMERWHILPGLVGKPPIGEEAP